MENIIYPNGHTVRSTCGRARLTYHPEWSASRPWSSYKNGTAGAMFMTLGDGIRQLTRDGYRFNKNAKALPE